jgi:hypothetical protein
MRALLLLLLAGCFDGTSIELELKMPPATVASMYSPSCVASVEVWINGKNYPTNEDDSSRGCVPLDTKPRMTWDEVHASISGAFEADIPDSGLGSVEVYGYTGPCAAGAMNDYDLVFFAHTSYQGGDKLDIPVTPNLSCGDADIRVRPIDVMKLVKTGQCAQAAWTNGKMAVTTLSPYPFTNSLEWWGGQNGANIAADGTAAFRGLSKPGPDSCLALSNFTSKWESVSCAGPAEQRACATGTEIEAPMISLATATATQDLPKITKWGSLVIGAAWGTAPLVGATVTLDDPSKGEVIYYDMPAGVENGTGALTVHAGTSTGASGLFGVYTREMVKINVTHNGRTASRMIGGYNAEFSQVALIKL